MSDVLQGDLWVAGAALKRAEYAADLKRRCGWTPSRRSPCEPPRKQKSPSHNNAASSRMPARCDSPSPHSTHAARFHLDFEVSHPFCDGNGRVGRVIINAQLLKHGLPPLIIRNSEKQIYYRAFREYADRKRAATHGAESWRGR